jgi:putative NADH-flavin reductase
MAKVLIIGASHGIGLETVRAALRAGHSVRALARSAAIIPIENASLDKVSGNALNPDTIRNVLRDIDVVIQTLGVDFSPRLIVEGTRLFSDSTRILVDAMKAAGLECREGLSGKGISRRRRR